jgi:hypothetical protein
MAFTPSVDSVDTRNPEYDVAHTRYAAPDATEYTRSNPIGKGANATTFAAGLAAQVEDEERRGEFNAAIAATRSGIDPHTLTYHVVTIEEMRQFVWRSLSNDVLVINETFAIEEVLNSLVMFDLFTNSQIVGYLVGANVGQVNGWRGWVEGLDTSIRTHVHGIPEQEP